MKSKTLIRGLVVAGLLSTSTAAHAVYPVTDAALINLKPRLHAQYQAVKDTK